MTAPDQVEGDAETVGVNDKGRRDEQSSRHSQALLNLLSHAVSTPITSMMARLHSLTQSADNLTKEQLHHLGQLDLATRRLGRLSLNLDYARSILSGRFRAAAQMLDLPTTIHDAVQLLRPIAAHSEITIQSSIEDGEVCMDPRNLQFVIESLVLNSIQHSPRKGEIHLVGRRVGEEIRIGIMDEGPGFPDGFENDVFELFSTGDKSKSLAGTGIGLGLFVCLGLVQGNGGRILVEPRSDAIGGSVVLRLPTRSGQVLP